MFVHLLTQVICWGVMAAGMFACALKLEPLWGTPAAIAAWAGATAAICGIGAALLQSQPVGVPTQLGAIGGSFVRWGFRAGGGRLLPAVAISWLNWMCIGCLAIAAIKYRDDHRFLLLELAWLIDGGVLFHLAGTSLANKRMPPSVLKAGAVIIAMLIVSIVLWSFVGTEKARHNALLIAGGPPLVIGGGYGLFLLVMLTVGRGARWN